MKTIIFSLRLDHQHALLLKRLARQQHRTRGDMVRRLIEAAAREVPQGAQIVSEAANITKVAP
jgi:hypothetical protein